MAIQYYTYKKDVPRRKKGEKLGYDEKKDKYYLILVSGKPKQAPPPPKKPAVSQGAKHRAAVIAHARSLVGIREVPTHSNDGPSVRIIQSSTGAYRAPWCASTVQRIWILAGLGTWANKTANAYYLAEYGRAHGCLIPHPIPGCIAVYHVGLGHVGTVVAVHPDGTFDAVEGNEMDAVRIVPRNPRHIYTQFVLRPELRG